MYAFLSVYASRVGLSGFWRKFAYIACDLGQSSMTRIWRMDCWSETATIPGARATIGPYCLCRLAIFSWLWPLVMARTRGHSESLLAMGPGIRRMGEVAAQIIYTVNIMRLYRPEASSTHLP